MAGGMGSMKPDGEKMGVKIFRVSGEYTVGTSEEYFKVCRKIIVDDSTSAILLDLDKVEKIDSAGFACMIRFIKEHLKKDIRIGLINMHQQEKELVGILKLERALELYNSEEEAIEALSRGI